MHALSVGGSISDTCGYKNSTQPSETVITKTRMSLGMSWGVRLRVCVYMCVLMCVYVCT